MESENRDQFDDLLDGALMHYGNVEPRQGLEGRVLANLAAAPKRRFGPRFLFATATAGCVCALVLVFLTVGTHSRKSRPIAYATASDGSQESKIFAASAHANTPKITTKQQRRLTPATARSADVVLRLSQFPSPRPLSKQEQMLKAYVNEFPKQAALIAKEQMDDEKEMEAFFSQRDTVSHLDQEK
jgi:hypothetical protein